MDKLFLLVLHEGLDELVVVFGDFHKGVLAEETGGWVLVRVLVVKRVVVIGVVIEQVAIIVVLVVIWMIVAEDVAVGIGAIGKDVVAGRVVRVVEDVVVVG
jgi:hypothetical protein